MIPSFSLCESPGYTPFVKEEKAEGCYERLLALAVAAGIAFAAALFVYHSGDTAFGAEVADALGVGGRVRVAGGKFDPGGEVGDVIDEVLLHSRGLAGGLAKADGALIEVLL